MGKRLVFKVSSAIMIAIVTATGLALNLGEVAELPFKWWPLISFIIFAFLVGWIIYGLYGELRARDNAKPRLLLHHIEPNVGDVAKIITYKEVDKEITKLVGIPVFSRIWICNDPQRPELGVDAENLFAEIEFYDKTKQDVKVSMSGRWPEVSDAHNSLKTQQVTIPPNRKPFCLDIIMKYKDDDDAYGYDDVAHNLGDGRNIKTKLEKELYYVKVILSCKGIKLPMWFKLDNLGKGQNVDFSEVND